MYHSTRHAEPRDNSARATTPMLSIVSEPGPLSLMRALGLLSTSGLSPLALDLTHSETGGDAIIRLWLSKSANRTRLAAVAQKIRQLPTVWHVDECFAVCAASEKPQV